MLPGLTLRLSRIVTCIVVLSAISNMAAVARASSDPSAPKQLFVFQDNRIRESSGIAVDPRSGVIFTIQDAGNTPDVFAIGPDGRTTLSIRVPYPNEDWEDIALSSSSSGASVLYVGDTGDAYLDRRAARLPPRTEYAVIRMTEPSRRILDAPTPTVEATHPERWRFVYEDRKSHNAETLLVQPRTGRVFVADKAETSAGSAYLWSLPVKPREDSINTVTRVAHLPLLKASGGDFSSRGDRLVLRNATYAFIWRVPKSGDIKVAMASQPTRVALPKEPQGEGVTWTADGTSLLLSSEGRSTPVIRVPLPRALRALPALTSGQARSDGKNRATLMIGLALCLIGLVWGVAFARRRST